MSAEIPARPPLARPWFRRSRRKSDQPSGWTLAFERIPRSAIRFPREVSGPTRISAKHYSRTMCRRQPAWHWVSLLCCTVGKCRP